MAEKNFLRTGRIDLKRAEMLLQQAKPNIELEVFDEPTVVALKEAMALIQKNIQI